MSEEMNLVRDLAVILIAAGIFTIISKALKQPSILGYIIAGFLVGPHITFFPSITSVEEVDQWSEIGIIFLMFALGLDFSFKKLLKVGTSALTIAGVKFIGVFVLGFAAGQAMDWTTMESIFLAGLLSMSSTAVVIKAYDEMGLKKKPFAGVVFGTLVVEDIIAILLMVLLSTMAVSNQFAGSEMVFNLAKLAFFIILWFLVGIYLIPTIFIKARKWINDEILLIVCIGLCFGMVTFAEAVGFSSALGAFVMGSILAETVESEHIIRLVGSIKDLFSAIFFVSVGMMIDPSVIAQHWLTIIIITVLVYLGHIVFAAAGAILSGKGLENAVHTGFSLAQLGEFGFILASVGCSLGVMRDFIYPVVISVSVITTFTTPYMIKLADPVLKLLESRLPQNILERLNPSTDYASRSGEEVNEWKKFLTSYAIRVVLYSVVLIAILICSGAYLKPLVAALSPEMVTDFWQRCITVAITLVVMAPFLYGLAVSTVNINESGRRLAEQKRSNGLPLMGLVLLRIFLAIGFVLTLFVNNFDMAGWTLVAIVAAGFWFFFWARSSMRQFTALENRFLENLNRKENLKKQAAPVATSVESNFEGYDVHIETIEVGVNSEFAGKKIKEIPFRKRTGANIVKIVRGDRSITIPDADTVIFPYDRLLAVGSTQQLENFYKMMKAAENPKDHEDDMEFIVRSSKVSWYSPICGVALGETRMREHGCMVISVMREGELITNPKPDFVFQADDLVWLAGDADFLESIH